MTPPHSSGSTTYDPYSPPPGTTPSHQPPPTVPSPYAQQPVPHHLTPHNAGGGHIGISAMLGGGRSAHAYAGFAFIGVLLLGIGATLQGGMWMIDPPNAEDFEKYTDPAEEYDKAQKAYADQLRIIHGVVVLLMGLGLMLLAWGLVAGGLLDGALPPQVRGLMVLGAALAIGLAFTAIIGNDLLSFISALSRGF